MTRVLPDPAPARIKRGPSPWRTASLCSGFKSAGAGPESWRCASASIALFRDLKPERCPFSQLGRHGDLAAVRLDDPFGDGQAQPGPALGPRDLFKLLEDLVQGVGRDAFAGVRDPELNSVGKILDPDLDGALVRRVPDG